MSTASAFAAMSDHQGSTSRIPSESAPMRAMVPAKPATMKSRAICACMGRNSASCTSRQTTTPISSEPARWSAL